MALGKATDLVNRIPHGQGFLYKIMNPGEAYLAKTDESKEECVACEARGKKATSDGSEASGFSTRPLSKTSVTKAANKVAKKGTSAPSSKAGPKAAVKSLIDAGYFATPRTGPEIHEYLNKKRGLILDRPD